MADDIVKVNDYGGGELTRRTRASGKARYTVTIRSEPIVVQTDPKALGAGPATAIRDHLKQRVAGIDATASPATIGAREAAARAVAEGKSWALKRYSGGRIGLRRPNVSDKLFHDSGRLIESIAVAATRDDGYVINVAANRLDPSTLNGGETALLEIIRKLREHVPEFGDARALMSVLSVRRAVNDALGDALRKANERTAALTAQLMRQTFGAVLRLVA